MKRKGIVRGLLLVALAALGVSGCAAQPGAEPPAAGSVVPEGAQEQATATETASPGGVVLSTAQSEYGEVVVDGEGMVLYRFDKDVQGADSSACEGECAQKWPAVPGDGEGELRGVTGELGTITGADGRPQLTLNGWPLYYFAGDQAPGQTNGQGLMDVWWVLDPSGEPIR